ncbi:hypothetical protein Pint_33807 [Pistacia integerrima]|uniref:Uncharacterized protein n=1 Tax=Pistacia integerrima TaxID=434235 RepID=A0ACC0X5N6_9ROSI|nr:hypothetical protein Pint_33807 [Pistacia integerrima]KAJ0076844.1 hypothetical protein Patl1_35354 [Pistacia atlantica]
MIVQSSFDFIALCFNDMHQFEIHFTFPLFLILLNGIVVSSLAVFLTRILLVENMNSLMAELMNVTAKERFFLEQCKDFSSTLAAMQVKNCSLRTHILQLNRVRTTRSLTTRV